MQVILSGLCLLLSEHSKPAAFPAHHSSRPNTHRSGKAGAEEQGWLSEDSSVLVSQSFLWGS